MPLIEIAGRDSQSGQTSEKAVSTRIKEDPKFKNSLKNNAILFFNKLKMNYHIAQCLSNVENIPNIRSQSILTSGIGIVIASRIAYYIFETFEEREVEQELEKLMNFDWSRSNNIFYGKIVTDDEKLLVSREAINVAVKTIKRKLGYSNDVE